jgi:hypothetical protein
LHVIICNNLKVRGNSIPGDISVIVLGNTKERGLIYKALAFSDRYSDDDFVIPINFSLNDSYGTLPTQYRIDYKGNKVHAVQIIDIDSLDTCLGHTDQTTDPDSFMFKENFTVIVCVDDNTDISEYIKQIERIKELRNYEDFRILPVYDKAKGEPTKAISCLADEYKLKIRNASAVDFTRGAEVNDLVEKSIANKFSIRIEDEIASAMEYLEFIEFFTGNKAIEVRQEIAALTGVLAGFKALIKGGDEESIKSSLVIQLAKDKAKIVKGIDIIRQKFNSAGVHPHDKAYRIFMNVVYSIVNICAMFSVVGTFYACQQFSHNHNSHGNLFKFIPTTFADEIKSDFADLEQDVLTSKL